MHNLSFDTVTRGGETNLTARNAGIRHLLLGVIAQLLLVQPESDPAAAASGSADGTTSGGSDGSDPQPPTPDGGEPVEETASPYGQSPVRPTEGSEPTGYGSASSRYETLPAASVEGWTILDTKFILGAERMTGLHSLTSTVKSKAILDDVGRELAPARETETSATHFSLLSGGVPGIGNSINPGAVPRVTGDFVAGKGVTIGGWVTTFSLTGEVEGKIDQGQLGPDTTQKVDLPELSGFGIGPRLGVLLPTDKVTFWLRGGLSYFSTSITSTDVLDDTKSTSSIATTQLNIDPVIVLSPVDHVGILLGPFLDLGVAGEEKNEVVENGISTTDKSDLSLTDIGVSLGIALFL